MKYQDTHVIIHYLPNTLTYFESTPPNNPIQNKNEPNATLISCIHHQIQPIRHIHQLQNFAQLSYKLNYSLPYVQIIPSIPLNTLINENHLWNKCLNLILPLHNIKPPPLPPYQNNLPPKFLYNIITTQTIILPSKRNCLQCLACENYIIWNI